MLVLASTLNLVLSINKLVHFCCCVYF